MGIRDFLMNLEQAQKSSGAFASTAGDLRKQAIQKQFMTDLPNLIESGDITQIGSRQVEAGLGDDVMNAQIKSMLAKKQAKAQYTPEALKTLGFSDKEVAAAQSLSPELMPNYVAKVQSQQGLKEKQREFNVSEWRRVVTPHRKDFRTNFDKEEKSLQDESRQLDKAYNALKEGSTTGDSVVLNYLARAVAGEKGPLAEGDIKRLMGPSFAGDTESMKNYILGLGESTLTPEKRKVYDGLINLAKRNFEKWKDDRLGQVFERSIVDYPSLLLTEKDGELKKSVDPMLAQRLKQYKYDFDPEKMSISKKTVKEVGSGQDSADLFSMVKQLPAPEQTMFNAAIEKKLNEINSSNASPEKKQAAIQAMKAKIQQRLGAK